MGVAALNESYSVDKRSVSLKEDLSTEGKNNADEGLFDDLLRKENDESPFLKKKNSLKEKLLPKIQAEETKPKVQKKPLLSEDNNSAVLGPVPLSEVENPKTLLKVKSDDSSKSPFLIDPLKIDPLKGDFSLGQKNLSNIADKNTLSEKKQILKEKGSDLINNEKNKIKNQTITNEKVRTKDSKLSSIYDPDKIKKGGEALFSQAQHPTKSETHYMNLGGKLHQVRTASGSEESPLSPRPIKEEPSSSQHQKMSKSKQRLMKEPPSSSDPSRSKIPEGRPTNAASQQVSFQREDLPRETSSGNEFSLENSEIESADTIEKPAFLTSLESSGASGSTGLTGKGPLKTFLPTGLPSAGAGTMDSPKFISVNMTQPSTNKPGTLSLRLMPENLGRIEVDVRLTGDGRLDAVVRTEKTGAFELFGRDSQTLKQIIAEAFDKDPDQMSFTLTNQEQNQEQGNGSRYDQRELYQSLRNKGVYGAKTPDLMDGTELAQHLSGRGLDTTRALDALV